MSGISTRVDTNPGASFTATGFFPNFSASFMVVSKVASLVCSARITSTSTMSGTGFMKCIPTNRSGRLVSAASAVTEIDDVLLAMMTSGRRMPSTSPSTARLISIFSGTASTTKSAAAIAAISVTAILPFLISRSRFLPIVSIPRSRKRRSTSRKITLYPDRANTCAIPFPIVPAPSTAIVLISERFKKTSRENTSGNGNTRHAESSSCRELFQFLEDALRRSCQGQPRGERGEFFILRPRRAKRASKLGNAAHQLVWFGAKHLYSAIQEFLLFDRKITQPAASARTKQRFPEKFSVRSVNQRVRSKNFFQHRKWSARSKEQAASREFHSLFLRSRFKLLDCAVGKTP